MFRKINIHLAGIITLLSMGFLASCGSSGSGSNNQGTSFLAYGYFVEINDTVVPTSAADVPLFTDVSPTGADGLSFTRLIGVQNRLTRQFIRLVKADCEYKIDGSYIDLPSDSMAMSRVLAPATDEDNQPPPVTGDPEINPDASTFAARIDLISPDMFAFINNNRAYLPQLPFRMVASCSVTGVTQAGDTITTNPISYFIHFYEEAECCTGVGSIPGFQLGTGTGGDFITIDDDN